MNSVFIEVESDIGDELYINSNGVVSLSEGSIDKLVDSIHVMDKPAKTVTVRTRLL